MMKVAIGMYTTLSSCTPAPAFKRAFSLCYQPVLKMLYNTEGMKFSLYQSVAMIDYLKQNNPEANMLITSLCRSGVLKLMTGIYAQSLISLNPPSERANQIEKMTTYIRRTYSWKPSTAFFYGQIWSPQFVCSLSSCGVPSVAISTYRQLDRCDALSRPCVMNELGKRVNIYPTSNRVSKAVSQYAQAEITFSDMIGEIDLALTSLGEDDEAFFFINIDQLVQGFSRMEAEQEEDDDVSSVITFIIDRVKELGGTLVHHDEMRIQGPGYLDSGWYGRDAYASEIRSFNETLVHNGMNRYMLNRINYLTEAVSGYKKDREIKNIAKNSVYQSGSGPLFIFDPQCGPLRTSQRRQFWKNIIDSERILMSKFPQALSNEVELEDLGEGNWISRNDSFQVFYSPFGGSVVEFDLMEKGVNVFDAKSPFDKDWEPCNLKRTFHDTVTQGGRTWETKDHVFSVEPIGKRKLDTLMSLDDGDLPFSVKKLYKLRAHTFILETELTAKEDLEDAEYALSCYLVLDDDATVGGDDQIGLSLLGEESGTKNVKIQGTISGVQLVFTSTSSFNVRKSVREQSQYTVLGKETFSLYNKFTFSFPFSIKKGESASFKMIVRASDVKSKE